MEIFYLSVAIFITLCSLIYAFFMIGVIWGSFYGAPFVPTNKNTTEAMLKVAGIKKNDNVYDLGSGDGRLVFAAAPKAKKTIGFEISLPIYFLSLIKKTLLRKKGEIRYQSFFKANLKDADVIFCYLLNKTMNKLKDKFEQELKKGCKIICHGFEIPGWKPLLYLPRSNKEHRGAVWVYVKN